MFRQFSSKCTSYSLLKAVFRQGVVLTEDSFTTLFTLISSEFGFQLCYQSPYRPNISPADLHLLLLYIANIYSVLDLIQIRPNFFLYY